jgi:hypothetical protein
MVGVSDCPHDCPLPGSDVHTFEPVLRRCGCPETLRMGSFGTFGTALTLVDQGTSGSYTLPIILGHRTLCWTARKRHEADLGPGSALETEADLYTAKLKGRT